MKIQFQADNDLDQRIVTATRRLGPAIDFQTAPALICTVLPIKRCWPWQPSLVSHDKQTLPDEFRKFTAAQASAGVILVSRKLSIGKAAEWLYLLWAASEAEEYANVIYRLP